MVNELGSAPMKVWISLLACCLSAGWLSAQNESDALRYSMIDPLGNARFSAMGGAFGALGGDLSAISWNPASTGVYRRNEVSGSLAISATNVDALYEDNNVSQSQFAFHIPQIGLVSSYASDTPTWEFFNLAIGYNKLRNFNQSTNIVGDVTNTSLLDVFLNQANGVPFDQLNQSFPFGAGLAWNTFLLDTISSNTPDAYFTALPDGASRQLLRDEITGHMGETVVSGGANYLDEWFFGVSLGFPVIRYNRDYSYTEETLDENADLQSFTYRDQLVTTGNGINIKLGTIYRANRWLRLSAAWHSPSVLSMNDAWDTEIISDFGDGERYDSFAQGAFDYNVRTPSRWIAGAAFILGKNGLVSADYEFIDYRNAELRPSNLIPNSYDFSAENQTISTVFQSTHNARIGAEWRVSNFWRLRGGFVFQQTPYVNDPLQSSVITYTGGVGYRGQHLFIEGAYLHRNSRSQFFLYDPDLVDPATLDAFRGEFLISVGFRY